MAADPSSPDDKVERFVIPRFMRDPLVINAVLLADVSTRHDRDTDDPEHWQEVRIYRTRTGKYVTEVVGRTLVAGENDLLNIREYKRPRMVVQGLYRTNDRGERYLTDAAYEALEMAHAADPAIELVDRSKTPLPPTEGTTT